MKENEKVIDLYGGFRLKLTVILAQSLTVDPYNELSESFLLDSKWNGRPHEDWS